MQENSLPLKCLQTSAMNEGKRSNDKDTVVSFSIAKSPVLVILSGNISHAILLSIPMAILFPSHWGAGVGSVFRSLETEFHVHNSRTTFNFSVLLPCLQFH